MTSKFKIMTVLTAFIFTLFMNLKAESVQVPGYEENIEDIAKKVYPSVVKVVARNRITKVATGVVIDKGGYIVTTALVSPRDEEIYVFTSEGKRLKAKFLGMDLETHLALIQAADKDLTPITLAKEKNYSPGSWVAVVSISPENEQAITQGIVSSTSHEKLRLNVWVMQGSSGSPVVNKKGHMIGLLRGSYINESPLFFEFREKDVTGTGYVFSKAEALSSGMAEAISVDLVKSVTSEIKEKGRVERGWLGVSIAENESGQVEIIDIEDNSPAELAKLKKGDIILELEGKKITTTRMLGSEIRKRKPKDDIALKIERSGKEKDVKVRLGELSDKSVWEELESKFPRLFLPKAEEFPKLFEAPREGILQKGWESRKYIGVYLEEINRELSEYFGLKEGRGLLISKISKDSPAEAAGLKIGDVIFKADGVRVEAVRQLLKLIQDKKKGEEIRVEFLRNQKVKSVEVKIEEEEEEEEGFFDFARNWDSYVDSWGRYDENLEKKQEELKGKYSENYKNQMKRLSEKLKEVNLTSKEAAKKFLDYMKRYKGVKV